MSQKQKRPPENFYPFYSDSIHQQKVASILTVLGAETFKQAKIIREIHTLQNIKNGLDDSSLIPATSGFEMFIFEYLVDCIRILVFFENYMKAELIVNGFCVHNIDYGIPEFKSLGNFQNNRPVKLKEVHDIEPFQIDEEKKTIFHRAVKFTTLQFNTITKNSYAKYYKFDDSVLEIIIKLAEYRNRLHFNHTLDFQLTQKLIDDFKKLNAFVDYLFANYFKGSEIS